MWKSIAILTLGTFAIGTDGFVVAGVLREIAAQLGIGVPVAGQLVTLFALVYALSSPVLASLAGRMPRRRLLLTAMVVFTVSNLLAALATTYSILAAARVIAAMAAAVYTPSATIAATLIAGERMRGRALALVLGGITTATIVGVPLGTWLGQYGGFHAAFWLVTGLGAAALAGLVRWLPELPATSAPSLHKRLRSLRLPGVASTLLMTFLAMSAGFTVYTYIGPLLTVTLHADARTLTIVLLAFGAAGALGNILSGWLVDHWGTRQTILLSLLIVTPILAVLPWLATSLGGALLGICLWNGAGWLLLPAQQHRLLASAPPHAGALLIALNASALYLGIAAAGLFGGLIIHFWGAWSLGYAAASIEGLALLLYFFQRVPSVVASLRRIGTSE